ncbi:MAG: DNA cytosine methyltransferase [Devosia sp.]|uniref:DNA cytosine methyltransferase n=1 Tax=Devosia sp. TaxID=1871048 RepID=UPI0024CD710D|nr:MAG: DNA cytosine methyltransferase [Devosia sp.]
MNGKVYYNEHDPKISRWLKQLIADGHLPAGDVDTRSIEDVTPGELDGYRQCHFFAGIGGWALAAQQAGWPADRELWSGSCPCQPFSQAGARTGFADERHLWPAWHWLIQECQPPTIVGEQVASKDANPWLDLVQADLEALGYAFGATAFPAAGVGSPQIRDRIYWMADAAFGEERWPREGVEGEAGQDRGRRPDGALSHSWRHPDWVVCSDGRYRPIEPGSEPLAHGVPARVELLRGYGNAVCVPAAREFLSFHPVFDVQPNRHDEELVGA